MIYITPGCKFFLHCHSNSPVTGSAAVRKRTTQTSHPIPPELSDGVQHFWNIYYMNHDAHYFLQAKKCSGFQSQTDCTNRECEHQRAWQQVWSRLGTDIIRKFVQNMPDFKESFCNAAFNYKLVPVPTILGGFTLCYLVFWMKLL